ncbi:hypothetical protein M422DRAFT_41475 [Sphaerobolus stellatus SS14]|nr:hypothetical protein M422DRAFT_41475 [Sphaerobolus stellatus SS14]
MHHKRRSPSLANRRNRIPFFSSTQRAIPFSSRPAIPPSPPLSSSLSPLPAPSGPSSTSVASTSMSSLELADIQSASSPPFNTLGNSPQTLQLPSVNSPLDSSQLPLPTQGLTSEASPILVRNITQSAPESSLFISSTLPKDNSAVTALQTKTNIPTISSSSSSPSSTFNTSQVTQSSFNKAAIIGAVVGGVIVLVLLFLLILVWRRRHVARAKESPEIAETSENSGLRELNWNVRSIQEPPEMYRETDITRSENYEPSTAEFPPRIPPIETLSNGRLSIIDSLSASWTEPSTMAPRSSSDHRPRHKNSIAGRVLEFLKRDPVESSWSSDASGNASLPGERTPRHMPSTLSQLTTLTAPPPYEA